MSKAYPKTNLSTLTPASKMMAFFRPLLPVLLQHIQQHRRSLRAAMPSASTAAGIPYGDAMVFSDPVFSGIEGVWRIKVHNDTFCEHDSLFSKILFCSISYIQEDMVSSLTLEKFRLVETIV